MSPATTIRSGSASLISSIATCSRSGRKRELPTWMSEIWAISIAAL
jgi:hypothetical protein